MRFTFFRSAWKKVPTTLIDMDLTELKDILILIRGLVDSEDLRARVSASKALQQVIWLISDGNVET